MHKYINQRCFPELLYMLLGGNNSNAFYELFKNYKLVIVSIQLKDHKSYLSYLLAKGNDECFPRGRSTCTGSHLLYSIYC